MHFFSQPKHFGLVKLQPNLNVKIHEPKHLWVGLDRVGLSWVVGLRFFNYFFFSYFLSRDGLCFFFYLFFPLLFC